MIETFGWRTHVSLRIAFAALALASMPLTAYGQTGPGGPAAPTGLTVVQVPGTRLKLHWTDNSNNETAFAIWRQSGTSPWAYAGLVAPNITSFVDQGLVPNTIYHYRVRAINNVAASNWSNAVSGIAQPIT